MPEYSNIYKKRLLETQSLYDKRIQRLFNKVAADISKLASDPTAKFSSSFDISKNYRLNKRIDGIMTNFHDEMLETIHGGTTDAWNLSNSKNDKIASNYLAGLASLKSKEKYFKPNLDALQTFITRKKDAKTLSDRIWKVADQFRDELEIHLGYGLLNGDSAATLSRRIRYYQNNPESLFRRVRDKNGNLVLSESAKQFHPGRGVYRSSFKNALRLTRETINQGYREADYVRWNQLDFVVGIKISLSAAHPRVDICDYVQGVYPKWFKWAGWHTQCLCIATPIMMSKEDFARQLAGEKVELPSQVNYVPNGFVKWVNDNRSRVLGWKNQPYWVQDNFIGGKISGGLNNISNKQLG